MAEQIELLKEAHRRGILPEEKKPLFDEAVKRGLIKLDDQPPAEPPAAWKQAVSTYGKPIMEAVGMVGGSMIGGASGLLTGPAAPYSVPAGAVAGGSLGYAAAQQGGKILDDFLFDRQPESPAAAVQNAGKDLATGAALEMGGQSIFPLAKFMLQPAAKAVRQVATLPGTANAAKQQAAEILADYRTHSNSAFSPAEAKNMEATESLLQRLGITDVKPTLAQSSGGYKPAFLEQGRMAANEELAATLTANDSALADAARTNLVKRLPVAPPISAPLADQTGAGIVRSLKTAEAPLRETEEAAWNAISKDYAMTTTNIDRTLAELKDAPLANEIKGQVTAIEQFYNRTQKTVGDIREVQKDITQRINNARMAGNDNDARILGMVKKAFDQDFKAMQTAAKRGDIADYNGKIVYPQTLNDDLARSTKALQEMEAAGSVPDADAVLKAIRAKGYPAMRSVGEDAASFNQRMANDYRKYFNQEPPMIADPKTAGSMATHQEKIARTKAILEGMKPADDVAAQIQEANAATIEKQRRFGRGQTADVLRYGGRDSGLKVDYEAVPVKYFSPSGAANLVKALGKPEAARLMSEHVTRSLENMAKNGILDVKSASRFIDKNRGAIDALGLGKEADEIVKKQIPAAIRNRLDKVLDVTLSTDRLGKQSNTMMEVRSIIKEFYPEIERYYGKGNDLSRALLDYHQMLQLLGRNKGVSYAGGSSTVEKFVAASKTAPEGTLFRKIVDNLFSAGAGAGIGTLINPGVGTAVGLVTGTAAKGTSKIISEHHRLAVAKLLDEALASPEAAQFVNRVAKGHKPTAIEMEKEMGKYGIQWKAPTAAFISTQVTED